MKKGAKRLTAMSNTRLLISVEEGRWNQALPDFGSLSDQVMATVFDYISSLGEIDFWDGKKPMEVNLCLSNDANVQKLNKEFRGMDKPTNVLSFANIDDEAFAEDCELYEEIELGDIIIALETLEREADLKQIPLSDHYCHLLTHGLLHLLGFDHIEDEEAEYMESCEVKILEKLNIKNPYLD